MTRTSPPATDDKLATGRHVRLTLTEAAYRWPHGTMFLGIITSTIDEKVMGVRLHDKTLLAVVRPEGSDRLKLQTQCHCCGRQSFHVQADSVQLIKLIRRLPGRPRGLNEPLKK